MRVYILLFTLLAFPACAQTTANSTVNSTVKVLNGGTGLTSVGSAGTFLKSTGTGLTYGGTSVTAAAPNVVITPSPGSTTYTVGITSPLHVLGALTTATVASSDMGKTLISTSTGPVVITLPRAGTTGFEAGSSYTHINLGTSTVTTVPTTSLVNTTTSLQLGACSSPPNCPWAQFISDGTDWEALKQ